MFRRFIEAGASVLSVSLPDPTPNLPLRAQRQPRLRAFNEETTAAAARQGVIRVDIAGFPQNSYPRFGARTACTATAADAGGSPTRSLEGFYYPASTSHGAIRCRRSRRPTGSPPGDPTSPGCISTRCHGCGGPRPATQPATAASRSDPFPSPSPPPEDRRAGARIP
jgi:hypothetical protein